MLASPRLRLVVLAVALGAVLGAGIALAASLSVSTQTLTTSTSAVSISQSTCTLSAADRDSRVEQGSATGNFGTSTELHVRSRSGSSNRRTFISISLASCSIPANALITNATLKLFLFDAPPAGRTHQVHRVTGSWTEAGITWNNQPAVAASATTSLTTGTTNNVTLAANVTSDVQAWVDGMANEGWRLMDSSEDSATEYLSRYRSAEVGTASQRPVLEVTWYP